MIVTLSFDLTLLYVFAANVIAILVYVLLLKHRMRRLRRSIEAISAVIADYFRADGIDVRVECLPGQTSKGFIAFIESEPMKRFRYSNIIETSLRLHVLRTCREDLDRVFWRFPFHGKNQAAEENAREMDISDDKHDEYIREGLEAIKKKEAYDIQEGSWDEFKDTVIKNDAGQKP
ncbi:MAG: hypothetical protein B7X93_01775 [Hydrogenophilales bacterium 17-61-9]|nr:MAG: hypothetical protein B7X93_01775 [Hydrogenophilales bacterium 17-61-9]